MSHAGRGYLLGMMLRAALFFTEWVNLQLQVLLGRIALVCLTWLSVHEKSLAGITKMLGSDAFRE